MKWILFARVSINEAFIDEHKKHEQIIYFFGEAPAITKERHDIL